jgi:hypothetical protein
VWLTHTVQTWQKPNTLFYRSLTCLSAIPFPIGLHWNELMYEYHRHKWVWVKIKQPWGDIIGIHNDMWTESPSIRGSEFSLVGLDQSEYNPRYIDLILPTLAVQIAYILTVPPFLMLSDWIFHCVLNYLKACLQFISRFLCLLLRDSYRTYAVW